MLHLTVFVQATPPADPDSLDGSAWSPSGTEPAYVGWHVSPADWQPRFSSDEEDEDLTGRKGLNGNVTTGRRSPSKQASRARISSAGVHLTR